ncbi:1-deoxy-D-xylulose-5-phosphate reductoisomerase [Rarobacter incanus]|uniref:1-deoxy-D-xylulose-5-phosphate reductoisomerase n=1 Tax=Rarobacter incanus TaxID=153494 RepID=UPI001FE33015|nr:1-deoxy-D-xylulose-5-phosphate reductoisomerase [Rarobacter incanus]
MAATGRARALAIIGSTGSIGTQALDVVARNRAAYRVSGLAATGSRPDLLARQVAQFEVPAVAIADPDRLADVKEALEAHGVGHVSVEAGPRSPADLAGGGHDIVLNAANGSIGLGPTLAALESGATLALANKESLVAGAPLVKRAIRREGQLVPVDSEHSAMAQAMRAGRRDEVSRLILTASGGPFRGYTRRQLATVTLAQALAHPTWSMGPVVTINSATLMNKALELIEAHALFDVPAADIEVVVHPQSIVHSAVEFFDGSSLAQVSTPDMRLPIAVALAWPDRIPGAIGAFPWTDAGAWTFEPLDGETFPAVSLAREAVAESAWHTAAMNAANEVAVDAFRCGRIGFLKITETVEGVLESVGNVVRGSSDPATIDDIAGIEQWARARARESTGG